MSDKEFEDLNAAGEGIAAGIGLSLTVVAFIGGLFDIFWNLL